jgi:hypothetical protein
MDNKSVISNKSNKKIPRRFVLYVFLVIAVIGIVIYNDFRQNHIKDAATLFEAGEYVDAYEAMKNVICLSSDEYKLNEKCMIIYNCLSLMNTYNELKMTPYMDEVEDKVLLLSYLIDTVYNCDMYMNVSGTLGISDKVLKIKISSLDELKKYNITEEVALKLAAGSIFELEKDAKEYIEYINTH